MEAIDSVRLNFSPDGLRLLNFILAFVMFSVALDIRVENFKSVAQNLKSLLVGVFAQLVALPAVTFLLILVLQPSASIALGMILVAACPGGNISNFMTHRAGGNSALSVSMTAISTLACIITTPVNLAFWGSLYAPSREILKGVSVNPMDMAFTVAILLGVPLALGMLTAHRFPSFVARRYRIFQNISMLIFAVFIFAALSANWQFFLKYFHLVIGIVALHNALALATGYVISRISKLSAYDRRALTIETGIQNSGLGLILIFGFFEGLGGMAVIAATWGIWHVLTGLGIATFWRRTPVHHRS